MRLPRFYPILDTGAVARSGGALIPSTEALLSAGVEILQLRHKSEWNRDLYVAAQRIASLCLNAGVIFVINDRADIAMLLNASIHVGQQDLPPADVRRIAGTNRILGFSTHNEAQLNAAATEPIDYVALGPIFSTASKQNPDPEVGVDRLRRLKPLARVPVVAIGGITRATAASVWAAGADSIAVVGDLYPNVRASAEEWMALANE